LGIPALEDKLVQLAASRVLSAIYEEDFLLMSFGYLSLPLMLSNKRTILPVERLI